VGEGEGGGGGGGGGGWNDREPAKASFGTDRHSIGLRAAPFKSIARDCAGESGRLGFPRLLNILGFL